VLSKYFFRNKMSFVIVAILMALQAMIIYWPAMQGVFHTTSVNFHYGWGIPIVAGAIVLIVTEIAKAIRHRIDASTISREQRNF